MRIKATILLLSACASAPGAFPSTPALERQHRLEQRLASKPDDAEGLFEVGILYARAGDGLRALQYLERSTQCGTPIRRSGPPMLQIAIGMGDYETARRVGRAWHEETALDCDETRPDARRCDQLSEMRVILAQVDWIVGDAGAAREMLRLAIAAGPRLPDPYLELARVERDRFGDVDAAREVLEQGIRSLGDTGDMTRLRAALERQGAAR